MYLRLVALIALLATASCADPTVVALSAWTWSDRPEGFGGISALDVGPDGRQAVFVSDDGQILAGEILRSGTEITGVRIQSVGGLQAMDGTIPRGPQNDAEGVVLLPNGEVFVSYEGPARVLRYADAGGMDPRKLPSYAGFRSYTGNHGLEALAMDHDGCLIALPEEAREDLIDIFRYCDGAWSRPALIPKDGQFIPVGADVGPDGLLYVLERHFAGVGFRSRIRRIDLGQNPPRVETLLTTRLGAYDNLEGLAVWRDEVGNLRLTAVSDDNFRWFQKTQIVEFLLTAPLAEGTPAE